MNSVRCAAVLFDNLRHRLRRDHAAGARPVVDDQLLAERGAQRGRESAPHQIGGAARGTREDQANWFRGPFGRACLRPGGEDERGCAGEPTVRS